MTKMNTTDYYSVFIPFDIVKDKADLILDFFYNLPGLGGDGPQPYLYHGFHNNEYYYSFLNEEDAVYFKLKFGV